jgi:HNH endonuclease
VTRPTADVRREVIRRAGNRCEYCLIHQEDAASHHQVDHVISEKHGGETILENLALSCLTCNRRKASDIGAVDPKTGRLAALFNPRRQAWSDHFRIDGSRVVGLTAEGRATAEFLQFNLPERMLERGELIRSKRYPRRSR